MIKKANPIASKTTVGHPVEITSGSVFTAWHDFELPGYIPLIWRRFYSTATLDLTPLGHGWMTPFFMTIQKEQDFFLMKNEEGRNVVFLKPDVDGISINPQEQMELRVDSLKYKVWDWHHKRYYFFSPYPSQNIHSLKRIEDYSGNSISIQYDDKNRPQIIEQSLVARDLVLRYGQDNLISSIELHHSGNSPILLVQYKYDSLKRLIEVNDPMGATLKYSYDANHRLICEVNQLGGAFYFEYDKDGKCIRSWGDGGYLERKIEYDIKRKTTRVKDSIGGTTTYFYNENGAVQKKVDAIGNMTEYQRSPGMDVRLNALRYVRAREYDEYANLTKYTDTLGRSHIYKYNSLGLCTSIIDPDGNCKKWFYDDHGCLIQFEDPSGNTWKIERGNQGEILKEIDPEGRELLRHYAIDLKWIEISDALGKFRCEYDSKGQPVLSSDSEGLLCTFETDAVGRITARKMSDGTEIRFSYNNAGKLTQVKYLNGSIWRYEYDSFGHIIRTTDPSGRSLRVSYDTEGRRTSIINERGEEYQEKYDLNGQMIERKYFDGRIERFVYDPVGQIIQIHRSDGSLISRQYDACGNMIEESLLKAIGNNNQEEKEILASYEYNWKQKMLKATNSSATIEFKYDPAGRFVGERQNDFEISYGYDKSGRLVSREILNGMVGKVSFEYDESGYMKAISDENGTIQEFKYNTRGLVTSRSMRGGIIEVVSYDGKNRLVYQNVRQSDKQIVQRKYGYDHAHNIVSVEDSLRGEYHCEYNSQLHLIKAFWENGETEEFKLSLGEDVLQRNNEKFEYGQGGRLLAVGNTQFDYDNNGNVQACRKENEVTQYLYDVKGQLTQVILPNGETVEFKYDPIGRRIEKQTSKRKTNFVWSDDRLTAVIREDKEPIEMLIGFDAWRPSVQWIGKDVEHFISDPVGMAQEVLDSQGNVKWWGRYSAYGIPLEIFCDDPENYSIRFPGQFEDKETGLFYNNNRYYDPVQTRYLTPDPIGFDGGVNIYNYPRNPINWTDPLGLRCPNPTLVEQNDQHGYAVYQHDDGTMTIQADCSKAFANRSPNDLMLRPTTHTGDDNRVNIPEAFIGKDGRVVVMEGMHRSAAASHGTQVPPDPDNPHLGGVPGRPGYMNYEYSPDFNNPDRTGVPLQDLKYPPAYPHKLP